MRSFLLLTGATGLLGRYLIRDLTARGVAVAALVRRQGAEPAAARLARVVAATAGPTDPPATQGPAPVCLEGNVNLPGLGLAAADAAWAARHCGRLVHSAASLEFRTSPRTGDPDRTNREGTARVLDFCRRAEIAEFHHVSTAYVCGLSDGLVREGDPTGGRGFRNDYERSKAEAERLIRAADFLDRPTFHRPAVIVGDSQTGFTSTYHGLYPYLQCIDLLRRHLDVPPGQPWSIPVRLNLTGDEGRNLVPVDWVSAAIADLVGDPACRGRTYHLTPGRAVTVREIEAAAAEVFGYDGPSFVGPLGLPAGSRNEFEERFYEAVGLYQPYWAGEPAFDGANTRAALPDRPCPDVDRALLCRLIRFAIGDRWGRAARNSRR